MTTTAHYRILLFGVACLLFSCRHPSKMEPPAGEGAVWSAADSLAFYFPQNQCTDLGFQYTRSDTFRENWYFSALFSLREAVLYGHYSKGGIYRFLWLRAFGPPVVLALSWSGGQVTLTTKVLDQQPENMETKCASRGWNGLMDELKGKTIERFGDSLIVVKADRQARIVFNQTKQLMSREWMLFELLLGKAEFWTSAAANDSDRGNDGSEWILESLQKDKYRFVARWAPGGAFRDAGAYLIKLSGLKGEIY